VQGNQRTQLLTPRCVVCGKVVALRVDPEDVERWRSGVFVQDAFADQSGTPYLDAASRELLISGTCGDCYALLCSPDPLRYH